MGRKKKTEYPELLVKLLAACNELDVGAIPSGAAEDFYNDLCPNEMLPETVVKFICWSNNDIPYETVDKTTQISRFRRGVPITSDDVMKLLDDKQMLRRIVRGFDEYREIPDPRITFLTLGGLQISFHPDSTITLASSRALDIFVQNKIPVDRLHICVECDDLYLSKKVSTPYCPKTKCQADYHNHKRAERRDQQQLDSLRAEYRRLRDKLKDNWGKSDWRRRERERIELELEDILKRGRKVAERKRLRRTK